MKKLRINLKTITTIIITALIAGGTTAFASYNYLAKDIEYEKQDGTKISVENAINELYNKNKIEDTTLHYHIRRNKYDGDQSSVDLYIKGFKKVKFTNEEGSNSYSRVLRINYNGKTYSISHYQSVSIDIVEGQDIINYDTTGTAEGAVVGGYIYLITQ